MEPRIIVGLRRLYRRFAGPEASLTRFPRRLLARIAGPDLTIRLRGKRFTINLFDDVVSASILAYRNYEVLETLLMQRLVRPGFVCADLGANIGYFTVLLGELTGPYGRVVAFEPQPNNARILRRNVRDRDLSGIVTVVESAVGARAGQAELFLAQAGNMGDFRVRSTNGEAARPDGAGVPVVTVDEVLADWPPLDFMKIDIQGFEMQALEGMHATLTRSESIVLLAEFWPAGLRSGGAQPRDFLTRLRELGFTLWEVCEQARALHPLLPARDGELVASLDAEAALVNLVCARSAQALAPLAREGDVWNLR